MTASEQVLLQQILQEVANTKQELRHVIEASEARILLTIEDYRRRISDLETENSNLLSQVESLEIKTRRNNIVIFGLNNFQPSPKTICEKLNSLLDTQVKEDNISDVYYLGKSHNSPVKVELLSHYIKKTILSQRKKLKGTNIYLNDDLTKRQQEENRILRKHFKEAKQKSVGPCYIRGNRLFRNGKSYTIDELEEREASEGEYGELRENTSAPETPTRTTSPHHIANPVKTPKTGDFVNTETAPDERSVGIPRTESSNTDTPKAAASKPKGKNEKIALPNLLLRDKLRTRPQK